MEIGIIIMLIILLSIVLTIVMLKSVNNDGSTLPKYDERQKIQRGRGYMFAFYSTLIIYCAIPFVTTESSRKFFNQFLFTGPALIGSSSMSVTVSGIMLMYNLIRNSKNAYL